MLTPLKLSGLVGLLKATRDAIEDSEEYSKTFGLSLSEPAKPTDAEYYGFLGKLLSCFLAEADDPYLVRNALERVESSPAFTDFCIVPYILYSLLYNGDYEIFHEYAVRLDSNPFKRYGITSSDLTLMVPMHRSDSVAKQLALLNSIVASSKDISNQVCKK